MQVDVVRDSHPNVVRRGPVYLAVGAVVVAGAFGFLIGYGLIRATCTETPPALAQLLAAAVPGFTAKASSCDAQYAGASLLGAALAAGGAGVVARLVLRAMTDWKKTPARQPSAPPAEGRA